MGGGIELEEAEKPQESKAHISSDVGGVPGINLIQSLITASFFHDMFCRFAYSRFTHVNTEDRVTALASQHKLFYRICRYSDYAYRAIAAVAVLAALVAIAGGAILKIFYPHLLPS
ncbi:hypothetical protein ACWGOE_04165 [Leucobacter chromiiresistens]